MRNVLKKLTAAALALAMCLSLAGCYDENNTWAAKSGDVTLPIGSYIYYLNSAYSEAAAKVSSDTEVLKATIEDKDATAWIKDRAMEYLDAYFYIENKFNELGLELTDEEKAEAQTNTSNTWAYYKTTFETNGIAQSSFHQAYSLYNMKYQKVMEALYSEGGELAIPEDELKTYFTENYYTYEYFYAPLTKTGEDGNSEDLNDDEKAELKKKFEGYIEKINKGETTVNDAANDYAYESQNDSTYNAPSPSKAENLNTAIHDAISGAKDNEAVFAETTSGYYVIRKLSIEDKFTEMKEDEAEKLSLIADMKGEEFSDYVFEQGKSVEGIEINQKALDRNKVSSLVVDENKNGTSSASSETESSSTSSTSSSEASSSEVSSGASSSQAE